MRISLPPRLRAGFFVASFALLACDEVDDRPADFRFIAPVVLAPNCATASCHSEGAAEAGLDLSTPPKAYRSLLGQKSQFFLPQVPMQGSATCKGARGGTLCETSRPLVEPCRPDESRLVHMLRARGAQRMPPDRPLGLADVELIERWILLGAKERPSDPSPRCALEVTDAAVPVPAPVDGGSRG